MKERERIGKLFLRPIEAFSVGKSFSQYEKNSGSWRQWLAEGGWWADLDHRSIRRQTFPISVEKGLANVIVAFSPSFFFCSLIQRLKGGVTGGCRFLSSYKGRGISAKRECREL